MSAFLTEDFLLQSEFAKTLYHQYAKQQPIIDYHCHLSPEYIAKNHQFKSLTEIWLAGDHYKWRAMRTLGVNEKYITGNASDEEKPDGFRSTLLAAVPVTRYRYRGNTIPTPWTLHNHAHTAETVESPVR